MKNPRVVVLAAVAFAAALLMQCSLIVAQDQPTGPLVNPKDGLSVNLPAAYQGYSLVAPMNSTTTYLVDMDGRVVNEWKSDYTPALSAYLLPNGHLLRPAANRGGLNFDIPAAGGRIQEFDWDGNLVWDFVLEMDNTNPHHDICPLPNGNVLVVATQSHTKEEVVGIGRRPDSITARLLVDCVLEIKPTGPKSGELVWAWYAWDHLIQDTDDTQPKYGEISEHPELIDINFGSRAFANMTADPEQLARLRTLGYVGGGAPPGQNGNPPPTNQPADDPRDPNAPPTGDNPPTDPNQPRSPRGDNRNPQPRGPGIDGDWMHTNAIAYNAELDQIMLSIHGFSEVWIIDHGTTTEEAAAHEGGRRGHGGDLLYRWGNPQAYRNGSNVDQKLFGQHCAHWIAPGLPGAGHLLVFNNGMGRQNGGYSSVDEVVLPLNEDGTYDREEYLAFGPEEATWSFKAPGFNSMLISGAQRLANGNTFVCSGNQAILFEATPDSEIVWVYKHPGGGMPGFDPGRRGEMFPAFVLGMLRATPEQSEQLKELQNAVNDKLAKVLSRDQMQQLNEPQTFNFGPPQGPPGQPGQPGNPRAFRFPRFGEVLPPTVRDPLGLSEIQENAIPEIQTFVDEEIAKIMTDEQKEQIEQAARMFAGGAPPFGPPGGNPPPDGNPPPGGNPPPDGANPPPDGQRGDRGPPNGDRPPRDPNRPARQDGDRPDGNQQPGGPQGPGQRGPGQPFQFGGPPGGGGGPAGIFRCYRYGADYPAFQGKDLTPGEKLEVVAAVPRGPGNGPDQGPGPNGPPGNRRPAADDDAP